MSRVPVSRSSDKVHDIHESDPDHDAFFLPDLEPSEGVPKHSVLHVAAHVRWLHGNRKPVPVDSVRMRRPRAQGPAPDEEPLV